MAYNYLTQYDSPNYTNGNNGRKYLIIHHWNDPSTNPQFEGIVSWLCNKNAQVSAHFVATGTGRRVACLVDLDNTAWHAGNFNANRESIGIECDPRCRDEDYDVVAELICELRAIFGDLPLKGHKDFTPTNCPGNWDLARLDQLARTKVYNGGFGKSTNKVSNPTLQVPTAIKLDKPERYTTNFSGVKLWDLNTNPHYSAVKEFEKGAVLEFYAYIPFNNTKYLVTEYSFSKGIKNGVNIADLTLCKPISEPEPEKPTPNPETPPTPPETDDTKPQTPIEPEPVDEPKPEPVPEPTEPVDEPKDDYDDVDKIGEEINKEVEKSWLMRILNFIINLIIKAITR